MTKELNIIQGITELMFSGKPITVMKHNNDECGSGYCKSNKKESPFDIPEFDMNFEFPSFGGEEKQTGCKPKGFGLASDEDIDKLGAIGRRMMDL